MKQIIVKEYKNQKAYQKDAPKMATKGYEVASVIEQENRAGCMRWLTIGLFSLIFKPKPTLLVTYRLPNRS